MSSHAIVVIVTPSPEDQIPVFRVGLTTLTLTRAHCKFWLCSECWKALSRDRFTKMIFQIGSSLQGSEEIYCPVTMLPGNKRHCQQKHSPPLPQQVSTSCVPSVFPRPKLTDQVTITSRAPPLFSSLPFCYAIHFQWWHWCYKHWVINHSHVPWSAILQAVRLAQKHSWA